MQVVVYCSHRRRPRCPLAPPPDWLKKFDLSVLLPGGFRVESDISLFRSPPASIARHTAATGRFVTLASLFALQYRALLIEMLKRHRHLKARALAASGTTSDYALESGRLINQDGRQH